MVDKAKWGVVVGEPTSLMGDYGADRSNIGRWVGDGSYFQNSRNVLLFNTRKEAREHAKQMARSNQYWTYHPKKYTEQL